MDKEYTYNCDNCGAEFTIITNSGEVPETCPFCGADLDNSRYNDEEDED